MPAASFISMVDAVFCTVSIVVILLVVIPRNNSQVSFVPQADFVASCAIHQFPEFTIKITAPSQPDTFEQPISLDTEFSVNLVMVQRLFDRALANFDRLSARVSVIFGGPDGACVDIVRCAIARHADECPRFGVAIRETSFSRAVPIVTIVYRHSVGGAVR